MRPDVASERARHTSACLGRAASPGGRRADMRAHPGILQVYVVRHGGKGHGMKRKGSASVSNGIASSGKSRKSVGFLDSGDTASRSGSSQNQSGLSSSPRTCLSDALNPRGGSVQSERAERAAKGGAARAAASERAAAQRAGALHAAQQ
eukprot:2888713-Pleurochrysis_carterae.AAC.1